MRKILLGAAAIVSIVAVDRQSADRAWQQYAVNREAVATIMGNLRKGMSRRDVEDVLQPHASRFFSKTTSRAGITWWTHTGLADAWGVQVVFSSEGNLEAARVSDEDGPFRPKEAPPDID
jgi:hypothetical protein